MGNKIKTKKNNKNLKHKKKIEMKMKKMHGYSELI